MEFKVKYGSILNITKKYIEYSETWLTFFKFLIQLSGDVQICINHVNFRAVVLSAQMVSQLSAS